MAINDNKISNVIGTHIPFWLLQQLKTRSKKGIQTNRDNENLKYLANKTGWVRLVSSINITSASDTKYFQDLTGITLSKPEDLAKNFVLYGGVSKYGNQNGVTTYTLRKGFKETYSMLGNQEVRDFGYRPMPGLTRVVVETQGRLGSIRGATIEFKVWDKSQLDVIDALYFKLGYMMFLEWGNTFYYESESSDLKTTELLSLDPFKDGLTKEQIALQLGSKRRESKGNYDGMLGMVSNFSFSYNQEGGYDCVLKLVGLGSLADSLKINQPATLAQPLKFTIEQLNNIYRDIQKEQEAKEKAEKAIADAKIKEAANKKKEEELNKNFKSYYDFLINDNEVDENITGAAGLFDVTQPFFKRYASAPSSLVVTNTKNKDYDKRKEYDYYYSPDQKLYIQKFGVILNAKADIDLQKTLRGIFWNSNNIKSRALVGRTAKEASLVAVPSGNKYFITTQYFSDSNYIVDPPYTGFTPYNFSIQADFITSNPETGNDITYLVTKQEMLQNIISYFTGEPMTYGEITRTNVTLLEKDNSTFISNTLKDKNGNYIAGFFSKKENSGGISFTNDGFYSLEFTFQYKIPSSTWKNSPVLQADGNYIDQENKVKNTISIPVTLRITDSDLISGIELSSAVVPTVEYQKYRLNLTNQNTGASAAENTNPTSNTSTDQTKPAIQYQSSLEATLRSIQIHSLIEAINASSKKIDLERKVKEIDLATEKFAVPVFSDGIFKDYIGKIINNSLSNSNPFEKNIKYGFNSALLSNKGTTPPEVDYKKLLRSYVLPYDVNQDINDGSRLAHPVYIQLGLLMFILNHCCNLYDEKTDKTKTPLLYMDYNPETNFCLSHPCHMTTNGMTFMIPFQGTFDDYKTLFYSNILEGDSIKGAEDNKNALTPLFSPEKDTISGDIPRFKGEEKIDAYRGKIMNVLVNIDYIFDIIKQFFSQDQTNSVFLKAFVEQILSDMNKTLGNFNIFRFSYDDTSNCLQIIDDQLVPGLPEESIVPNNSEYDIPIYGRDSIARSLDLRTDISSKMANVLAISANAEVQKQSANSVDGTPYGFINQNYRDRYISNRTENSNIIKKEDGKKTRTVDQNDAIVSSALKFNKNVIDFYGTYNPSTENIGHATNYYIEKLSVSKLAPQTRAAAMIPVSVNFTLDGISGFNMMQGFTISEKFLPYTYNLRDSSKGTQKVGFMVTGNVHTIENNEWTTAIKANMTYLKERGDFSGSLNTSLKKGKQAGFNPEGTSPDQAIGTIPGNYTTTQASGYSNIKFSNINLGNPAADVNKINANLLADINKAAVIAGVTVQITTAVSGHTSVPSRHPSGKAVDIAIINGKPVSKQNRTDADKFVKALVDDLKYAFNSEKGNAKAVLTFDFPNHDNHVHVSNTQS
jgi:hypothetical protein